MMDNGQGNKTSIVDTARAFVTYCRAMDLDPQTTLSVFAAALGMTLDQCGMTWEMVAPSVEQVVKRVLGKRNDEPG
jgi:hypothetical protein